MKSGDTATGMLFCQTSKYWKNAVMVVLCQNIETSVEREELAQPVRHIAFWSLETKEEFIFFTKCNSFTDLIFCCFTVTVDVWRLMCSAKFPVWNMFKWEWIYLYQKIMCSKRWTLKYWDRTECVFFSPWPVLLFIGKTQESATCQRRCWSKNFHSQFGMLPTWCSICHKLPGLKEEKQYWEQSLQILLLVAYWNKL